MIGPELGVEVIRISDGTSIGLPEAIVRAAYKRAASEGADAPIVTALEEVLEIGTDGETYRSRFSHAQPRRLLVGASGAAGLKSPKALLYAEASGSATEGFSAVRLLTWASELQQQAESLRPKAARLTSLLEQVCLVDVIKLGSARPHDILPVNRHTIVTSFEPDDPGYRFGPAQDERAIQTLEVPDALKELLLETARDWGQ